MTDVTATPGRVCPGCHSAMQTFRASEVELERCFFCGGVFLEKGELDRLVGGPVSLTPGETPGDRLCAGCGATLAPTRAGALTVDQCRSCGGLYLDAGELQRLAGEVSLTRADAPPHAEQLRFKCPGCGETLDADQGVTTGRGLACPGCAPGLDSLESVGGVPPSRDVGTPIGEDPYHKPTDPMAFEAKLFLGVLQALALFLGI